MKRKILMALICCFVMTLVMVSLASAQNQRVRSGPAGKSNIGHLYDYQKIEPVQPYPPNTPWEIDEDGAWAKMAFRQSGPLFRYVFNGHKLVPSANYTLIYYPDPWPGTGLICLGSGTANGGGNIHLNTAADIDTSLPIPEDLNNPANPGHENCVLNSTCIEGAKIWLVLSSDVDCNGRTMVGWDADSYLFEEAGIFFAYTGGVVTPH